MLFRSLLLVLLPLPALAGDITSNSDASGSAVATVTMTATLDSSSTLTIKGRGTTDPFTSNTQGPPPAGTVAFTAVDLSTGTATGPAGGGFWALPGTRGGEVGIALVARTRIEATVSGASSGQITITGTQPAGGDASAEWLCPSTDTAADWVSAGALTTNTALSSGGVCHSWTGNTISFVDADFGVVLTQGRQTGVNVPFTVTLIPGT